MDVVCDQCRTEYEFDDALVSERGTTVKCTTCGHQFRIFRPKADGTVSRPWILRRGDGKTATFDSLAVLQRWIGEGKAARADLLSRDGVDWKPLGSIAELEGFFAQADAKSTKTAAKPAFSGNSTAPIGLAATVPAPNPPPVPVASAAAQPPPPPRRATTPGMAPAPPPPPKPSAASSVPPVGAPPPSSLPNIPSPSTAQSGLLGGVSATPAASNGPPAAKFSMGGSESELTTEAYDFGDDTGIVEKWGTQGKPQPPKPAVGPPPISAPPPKQKPPQPEARPRTQSLDETVVKPKSRGVGLFIGAGILAMAVGGSIALFKSGALSGNRNTTANPQRDAVSLAIDFADESARAGTRAGYDEARERLTLLLTQPQHQNDPRLHAARGAILAARGESIRQRADDGEARAQSNPNDAATLRAEAALLRGGASADLERARSDGAFAEANQGQVSAADRPRFLAALGEIARVVRADLQAARRYATEAHGLGLNVDVLDGLIARDAGEYENAVSALRRATSGANADARGRLALARLYASHGDASSAHEQLNTLMQTRASHDEAQALMQAIDAHLPPFVAAGTADGGAPVVAQNNANVIVDSGVRVAANNVATNGTDPAVNNGSTPPANGTTTVNSGNGNSGSGNNSGGSGSSGAFAGRGYDSLVSEGERLRERGRMEPARSAFMAALQIRGDGCEAISGLAAVEVASGDERAAVLLFRRALSINSRYSDAYFGLGQAYERMGNSEGATNAYRQYLEVNPGGSRSGAARTRLEALERRNSGASSGSGSGSGSTGSGSGSGSGSASPPTPTPSESPANSGSTSPPSGATPAPGGT